MLLCVINAVYCCTEKTQCISISQRHFAFEIARNYLEGKSYYSKIKPFFRQYKVCLFF